MKRNRIMPICCIVPPHVLRELAQKGNPKLQAASWHTLTVSDQFRGMRGPLTTIAAIAATSTGEKRRTVYDAKNGQNLPGKLVRGEGSPAGKDVAVNEAYDAAGTTHDFYQAVFDRNSIDGQGMRLDSSVHYGTDYDNAFWNGQQMVYGDGDGEIFQNFTSCIDVIGHELTHGVTQFEAGLNYQDQPGALNESFSDVFGSLVKQYSLKQTADQADWLIGKGLLTDKVNGVALRSMKAPGTAYDDPQLGKDPQPDHMSKYLNTHQDNGGVHINSGIPNKAFFELATRIGGNAWETPGKIWYNTLLDRRMQPDSDFQAAADITFAVAGELFGADSDQQQAVRDAWNVVGITVNQPEGIAKARKA